jgi:hypothetical protein
MNPTNNITDPKCSNCKCYFIPTMNSSGQPFKTCDKCRTKDKETRMCEHDKRKNRCIQCGGSGIFEHNKEKYTCKQCGGGGICEHDKRKSESKLCGGNQLCENNKRKK